MRTLSHPVGYLIVIASAVSAVLLVRTVLEWSRWILGAAGTLGIAGLALAAAATVNLGISRTCMTDHVGSVELKEVNRPAISVVLGSDDCYTHALGQFEILGVIVVGVSAEAVRRSTRGALSASPAARRL